LGRLLRGQRRDESLPRCAEWDSIRIPRNRGRPRRLNGARVCDPQHPSNVGMPFPCRRRDDFRRWLRVTDPRSRGCGVAAARAAAKGIA
jgi:hypothetical protein